MRDEYKLIETSAHIEKCPCCGDSARLWRYSEDDNAPTSKVVMCQNGEAIGLQEGLANEGCPLYMPGNGHYKATEREAVKYWNEFSQALTALQRKNRWAESRVLRAESEEEYLLQDTRSFTGNCPMWWKETGGYTSRIDEARRFKLADAIRQHISRDTDVPWLLAEIAPLARPTIDMQELPRSLSEQIESLKTKTKLI